MERSVFLKIMNNQTQRFPSLVVAVSILSTALAATPARGQSQGQSGADRVSVNLSDPTRPALVKASLVNGGITVKAYGGKEVVVEARARNHESAHSDSTMKRIPISGTGLSVEEENNEVRVSTDSFVRAIDLSISVPIHTSLKLSAVNAGDIVVTGVDGELDVNDVNGSVTLNNVSGSAVAHALNGRLLATFSRVNPQKPMAFSSLNGDIDVTFPADLKANLSLKSDRGEIFSDFDVQVQASAPQQIVEDGRGHGGKYLVKIDKAVHATINGGGPELQFTNFNGGIYIRKAGSPR
jgi:Putative adhesin